MLGNLDEAGLVLDYRVCVTGTEIPIAFKKWRPINQRFANWNVRAEIVKVEDCLSAEEQTKLLTLCREMGLDFGDIDLIRDRNDERLYVIDVNKTPCSPSRQFHNLLGVPLMHKIARAFELAFLT